MYTGTQNTLRPMEGMLLLHFNVLDSTKYNELNVNFCNAEKHVTNKVWHEYSLSTEFVYWAAQE